uniref:ANK_REP_REGION domain-containing protein n=1 Tax=Steinernema glaseri TaxID=37863 RepID=A0A1I7Z3Z2_9BILA
MADLERFPLHKAAFFNDTKLISHLIQSGADLYEQDMHGNTALHISTMLGHRESTALLLAHNAPVKIKNRDGWNTLMEAISYGDRQIITTMLRKLKAQSRESMVSKKPHLIEMLSNLGDFYLELKWDFHSWIPLLSKMLPSDVCKIYKRGTSLRLDTTLVDFNDRSWERGDISFIYNSTADKSKQLVILDNKAKVFQRVRHHESDAELDEEVDVLMSSDIVSVQMSTKPITFERAYSGWIFKQEKSETVGEYESDFYSVEGMTLVTRKRREHLTSDDIKKNKAFMQSLSIGNTNIPDEDSKTFRHRKSLPPPGRPCTTWDEYLGAAPGVPPPLGRQQVLKSNSKTFKACVAMSEQFPLTVDVLVDILEIIAPFKHLNKLRRFCEVKLPPGFPVKLEIPLLPTISAKVTFQKFVFRDDLTFKMFRIPKSYREDSNRFPDL